MMIKILFTIPIALMLNAASAGPGPKIYQYEPNWNKKSIEGKLLKKEIKNHWNKDFYFLSMSTGQVIKINNRTTYDTLKVDHQYTFTGLKRIAIWKEKIQTAKDKVILDLIKSPPVIVRE